MKKDHAALRDEMRENLEKREPIVQALIAATMVYREAMFVSGDAARKARERVLLLSIDLSEWRP